MLVLKNQSPLLLLLKLNGTEEPFLSSMIRNQSGLWVRLWFIITNWSDYMGVKKKDWCKQRDSWSDISSIKWSFPSTVTFDLRGSRKILQSMWCWWGGPCLWSTSCMFVQRAARPSNQTYESFSFSGMESHWSLRIDIKDMIGFCLSVNTGCRLQILSIFLTQNIDQLV